MLTVGIICAVLLFFVWVTLAVIRDVLLKILAVLAHSAGVQATEIDRQRAKDQSRWN